MIPIRVNGRSILRMRERVRALKRSAYFKIKGAKTLVLCLARLCFALIFIFMTPSPPLLPSAPPCPPVPPSVPSCPRCPHRPMRPMRRPLPGESYRPRLATLNCMRVIVASLPPPCTNCDAQRCRKTGERGPPRLLSPLWPSLLPFLLAIAFDCIRVLCSSRGRGEAGRHGGQRGAS